MKHIDWLIWSQSGSSLGLFKKARVEAGKIWKSSMTRSPSTKLEEGSSSHLLGGQTLAYPVFPYFPTNILQD